MVTRLMSLRQLFTVLHLMQLSNHIPVIQRPHFRGMYEMSASQIMKFRESVPIHQRVNLALTRVLFNVLAVALAMDASTNGGPADPSRMDLASVCQNLAATGLDVNDVTRIEGLIPLSALNVVEFTPGVTACHPSICIVRCCWMSFERHR